MNTSPVCVDASFVARLFVGPEDSEAWKLLDGWIEEGRAICSPTMVMYELANVFYRYHKAGHLSLVTTELVLDAALAAGRTLEGQSARAADRAMTQSLSRLVIILRGASTTTGAAHDP
jgi:predicted nucleic acid-binding protein